MAPRERIAAALLAVAVIVLLERARGHADWGPSEGVYALSSRLLLHGGDLYGGLVASQPPWVYLFGAIPLSIHDSLDTLRFACGLLQVLTGVLAGEVVWRLTCNRLAAFVAVPLVVLTPWAVHQHGLLLPEQLGSPLLMGAALLAARSGGAARLAGVLAGIAVFTKLPFALPAAALIAVSPARAVAARWAAGSVGAQAVAFTIVFGTGFWSQTLKAQAQAGHGLELQIGSAVQATWNLLALLVFAAAALSLRRQAKEPALLLTVAAAAVGMLVTTVTIIKPGTGLNVLVPSEPLLAALAVSGVVWALRTPLRVRAAVAAAVLGLLMLAQSASLLLDPTNPRPFMRPASSSPGWKVGYTREQVADLVAQAEHCPAGAAWTGPQLVAFITHRRVPADEPDFFIVSRAKMHRAVFARMEADRPTCP
jgi:hypothetical protein